MSALRTIATVGSSTAMESALLPALLRAFDDPDIHKGDAMKNTNNIKSRTLKLTGETIKNLRREDLVRVAGGTDPSILTCEETVCVTRIKCEW